MSNRRAINKAIKMMKSGQYSLEDLGIEIKDVIQIVREGYCIKDQYDIPSGKRVYYITPRDDMAYTIISRMTEEEQELKLLQISDLHAGSQKFDEEGLRRTLQKAKEKGVEYVHISGDLLDGHRMYRGQEIETHFNTAEMQVELLLSIFSDYDFKYIASEGNHDESFRKDGSYDPLKMLETKMQIRGKQFTYLQAYEGNIVHCGVVFRLIHLAGGNSRSKSYKTQIFIANTLETAGNDCILGKEKFNIRSIQAGHFHTFYSFSMSGIDASTPGNFKFDNNYTKRMGITGITGGIYKKYTFKKGQIVSLVQEYI